MRIAESMYSWMRFRRRHSDAPLGDGPHQLDVVHVLERAHVLQDPRPRAADHDHRDPRALRVGDSRHDVRDAGPRCDGAHAGLACDARVPVGGVPCRLLVPHVDDADAVVETAVVNRLDVPAAEREEVRDPVPRERLGNEPTAMNLRHARDIRQPRPEGTRPRAESSRQEGTRPAPRAHVRKARDPRPRKR
jgi:hypothetical protein